MMTPEQNLAFLISMQLIDVGICVTRFMLLRHHTRNAHDWIADTSFLLAFSINFSLLCLMMTQAREERRALDLLGGNLTLVAAYMYKPYWTRITYVIGLGNIVELWSMKAAFLSFYWGLFNRTQTRLRFLLHMCIAVVAASGIAVIIMYLTWCTPIQNNWASDYEVYVKCAYLSNRFTLILQSALNISTDVLILLLPILVISRLLLERNVRIALIFAFLLGGVALAATIVRHIVMNKILHNDSTAAENYTRRKTVEVWGIVEISAAMLAFCLPLFRRHLVRIFGPGGVLGSSKNRSASGRQSGRADVTVGGSSRGTRGKPAGPGRKRDYMETDVTVTQYLGMVDEERPPVDTAVELQDWARSSASSQERLKGADECPDEAPDGYTELSAPSVNTLGRAL